MGAAHRIGRKSIRQFDRFSCNVPKSNLPGASPIEHREATLAFFHLLLVRNFVGYLMALFFKWQGPSVGELFASVSLFGKKGRCLCRWAE